MVETNGAALTPEQVEHFDREGYLIVRDLLPKQTVDALRRMVMSVVDRFAQEWLDEGLIDDLCADEDFAHRWAVLREKLPSKTTGAWRTVIVSPELYALWQEPALVGAMRSLIGDELFANGIFNARPREPGSWDVQRVTWHQDAAYYPDWDAADGRLVTCWTPLVPVNERSGCLQFVPGSHKRGYVPFERVANGLRAVPESFLGGAENPFSAELNPGDVVMFDATMLHQALDNRSDYTRWSVDVRYGPANPTIIAKSGPGYYCVSAADQSRVETFDQWSERFDAERAKEVRESAEELEARAKALGISKGELQAF